MGSDDDSAGSITLQLLSKYNYHTSERDRSLENKEKNNEPSRKPSYDALYKENTTLKLQLEEYESEIASLKRFIDVLKNNRNTFKESHQQLEVEDKLKEPILPPRSAERRRNAKNLSLPVTKEAKSQAEKSPGLLSPAGIITSRSFNGTPTLTDNTLNHDRDQSFSLNELDKIRRSSSSYSNVIAASPATSVAYTTSRISPSRSNKHSLKDEDSASSVPERSASLLNSSKAVISVSDHYHSPLRIGSGGNQEDNQESSSKKSYPKSPIPNLLASHEGKADISPASKKSLNNFAEMLDSSFGEDEEQTPHENPQEIEVASANQERESISRLLGSPVALKKPHQSHENSPVLHSFEVVSSSAPEEKPSSSTIGSSASTQIVSAYDPQSPRSINAKSIPHLGKSNSQPIVQSPRKKTTPTVTDSHSIISDIPLFVQPGELGTIRIDVVSTLHRDNEMFAGDHHILFSVIDRTSGKEIFKFAKTIDRVYELDVYLKCHMDTIMLPPLPEKAMFETTTPLRVDYRREKLNDYFSCLFAQQNLLPDIALKLAKFISTDTVMNPIIGDYIKEGILMMRKSKAIGSTNSWRLRYAVVDGVNLSLLDRGQVSEIIKLSQAAIELQANLPDDRYGTKNGFILNVHKKGGLSSGTRYFFCCESPRERESWVSSLAEFVESSVVFSGSINSKSESSSMIDHSSTGNEASSDAPVSYIGPIANLQSPVSHSPTQAPDTTAQEDERESKRIRMRSFFPFKRATAAQTSSEPELPLNGDSSQLPLLQPNETSISRSLQAMDLGPEIVSNTVFGSELRSCVSISSQLYQGKYVIPSVVYRCLEYLYRNHGVEEEGIFRISGSSLLIKSLQEQFDKDRDIDLCNYNKSVTSDDPNKSNFGTGLVDVNTVTGLLKLFLRKMPHVIFGDSMLPVFKSALDAKWGSGYQVALEYRRLVNSDKISKESYSLMFVLFELLVKINQKNQINKMNLRNLCIVFSPTLNIPVSVLQPFIVDFDCIFKNEEPINDSQREQVDIDAPSAVLKEINSYFA
ncbi:GTPase-activating protein BEM3 [Lachancea thermotolerans CBS 6340]|uniref:KLTH0D09526p n=1 Tax=Lachancea thermotolerans (strain ATCC 56472 / CBS 6340 / NRRL Y-8284) TaxID=559295 RepID=C5DGZ4_LACTC|nr:KLTH0D09526p [Lachancea thermotolerans CBS 6340]CAR22686.1 KLTH0D09526p [Lachancea thermotolerans CBS 6340]